MQVSKKESLPPGLFARGRGKRIWSFLRLGGLLIGLQLAISSVHLAPDVPKGTESIGNDSTDLVSLPYGNVSRADVCLCTSSPSFYAIKDHLRDTKMVLATAVSQNHYLSVLPWLRNARQFDPDQYEIIIYDIGLDAESLAELACYCAAHVVRFDFSKEPKHVALDQPDAGAYAWKPIIIEELLGHFDTVIWTDSGNRWNATLMPFVQEAVKRNGLYSGTVWGRLGQLMHPAMYKKHYNDSSFAQYFTKENRNCDAAFVIVTKMARAMVSDWVECARVKECILPTGGSKRNHRWDQSALAYLVYSKRNRDSSGKQHYYCRSSEYHETLTRWNDHHVLANRSSSVLTESTPEACEHHIQAIFGAFASGKACTVGELDTTALCVMAPRDWPMRILVVSKSPKDECTALGLLSGMGRTSSLISLRLDAPNTLPIFEAALDRESGTEFRFKYLGRGPMIRTSTWPNDNERFHLVVLASAGLESEFSAWVRADKRNWPPWGVMARNAVGQVKHWLSPA